MANGNYEFQSDFHKKADAAGRAKGHIKGEADALLLVLDARGIAMTDEQKARVFSCTDATTLEAWIRKAATASSADELFND